MAYKRQRIGSVVKSKEEGGKDYIKINEDVSLKKGDTLQLESKASQLASVQTAVTAGKLKEEHAVQARERISNIPEWVRFEIVKVTKE